MKFYPYQKGGQKKKVIVKVKGWGGGKKFPPFKRGGAKSFTLS